MRAWDRIRRGDERLKVMKERTRDEGDEMEG